MEEEHKQRGVLNTPILLTSICTPNPRPPSGADTFHLSPRAKLQFGSKFSHLIATVTIREKKRHNRTDGETKDGEKNGMKRKMREGMKEKERADEAEGQKRFSTL
ncbi:hypothetical protein KOW79_017175 [Hemibagrus wyckioides]|uniref:Uncharacterized protein n=1 Tax=Hemibagrus wyckioides TaxID=337641 RepID=A0A9D3SDF1_9TELE|nr:hypothetical protein KOW79_017175 [Hemibagrus wyckioides]